MNRVARSVLAVFVLLPVGGSVIAAAQDMSNPHMPPKILVIGRDCF